MSEQSKEDIGNSTVGDISISVTPNWAHVS